MSPLSDVLPPADLNNTRNDVNHCLRETLPDLEGECGETGSMAQGSQIPSEGWWGGLRARTVVPGELEQILFLRSSEWAYF